MDKQFPSILTNNSALVDATERLRFASSSLSAMREWLLQQLSAQVYAKLGQGGHTQNQIPLRQVFIDLPVTNSPNARAPELERALFLHGLLSSAPLTLADAMYPRKDSIAPRESADATDSEDEVDPSPRMIARGFPASRFSATLLIGGPGQGKSTLGQLACQLHRAALLSPFINILTSSQKELVASFLLPEASASKSTVRPLLPIQVSLPDLSAWLATRDCTDLSNPAATPEIFQYIASQPSAQEAKLTAEILHSFAKEMPTLIVLDGFDEIGATQDRTKLVAAGSQLLANLRDSKASAQVLATTRPQGYAGELAGLGLTLRSRYLAPLATQEAMEYGRKLVSEKIPDPDLRQRTLARLSEAANEPATQRLLTTPLQVTILTALVQQLGRAPRERWNLFYRYFAYTYDREIERGTYASRLLAEYRTHIEKIHARVGLLLQVAAERDGGASARMTRASLEDVIREVLLEDEIDENEIDLLVTEIAAAADQRLVFLVEPEPNRFGFEIRSLQEFMAAWALSSGRDSVVEARLMQVAKASMFRNVALFIASRFFSEGSPLRDVLATEICGTLDDDKNDSPAHATKVGAMLALETLEEGAVLAQPKRARALMQRAIRLLDLPPNNEHPRLAQIINSDTLEVFRQLLENIDRANVEARRCDLASVCICLIVLVNRGHDWARPKLERYWAQLADPSTVLHACRDLDIPISHDVAIAAESLLPTQSVHLFVSLQFIASASGKSASLSAWIANAFDQDPWERATNWQICLITARPPAAETIPSYITPSHQQRWSAWVAMAQFQYAPSASSLANALDVIAQVNGLAEARNVAWAAYWPLATCLYVASNSHDLIQFSTRLRSGELGDINDWTTAESAWGKQFRWTDRMADLLQAVPWSKASINYSPPVWSHSVWSFVRFIPTKLASNRLLDRLHQVNDSLTRCSNSAAREMLASACLLLMRRLSSKTDISSLPVKKWLTISHVSLFFIATRPRCTSEEQWSRLLGETTLTISRDSFFDRTEVLSFLSQGKISAKTLRLTISFLQQNASVGTRIKIERNLRLRAIRSLNAFRPSTEIERADHALARIFVGAVSDFDYKEVLEPIIEIAKNDPAYLDGLLPALQSASLLDTCPSALAVGVFNLLRGKYPQYSLAVDLLREILQARKSGLENQANWNKLKLPLPMPPSSAFGKSTGFFPDRPIALEGIRLRDVRGISDLQLQFTKPLEGLGQWIVFLGQNGAGKTTLLRSIAVALRDAKNPAIWPKGAFASPWNRVESGSSTKIAESRIEVTFFDETTYESTIRDGRGVSIAQTPELSSSTAFPIFAYGCRRGSALGGSAREVNLGLDDGPEIATLFDDASNLIHAETWLIQLEGDALKSDISRTIYSAVVEALRDLLDVDKIFVSEKRVWITEIDGPTLPFSSLSDGYLTSAGWFIDLIARWIELADRNNVTISDSFLSEMKGLILIDEIDLHLHPRWQIEIISRTRRLLPSMSFIVTTHNPLTLVGAKAEEIWILERTNQSISSQQGLESPMLLTGGQLYRRYFGIEDVFPDHLGRALQRYSFLCGYSERDDNEENELNELMATLDKAGIRPQWDVVSQSKSAF